MNAMRADVYTRIANGSRSSPQKREGPSSTLITLPLEQYPSFITSNTLAPITEGKSGVQSK